LVFACNGCRHDEHKEKGGQDQGTSDLHKAMTLRLHVFLRFEMGLGPEARTVCVPEPSGIVTARSAPRNTDFSNEQILSWRELVLSNSTR
jgi:hypothetical protein